MWKNRHADKAFQYTFVLLSVLAMSACSGLNRSDKPPIQTWWLEPYSESIFSSSSGPKLLVDVNVNVVPGLDTNKILTLSSDASLSKYSAARWADSLPELLTSLVSRSLDESGRFEPVAAHVGAEQCTLNLEAQEFYALLGTSGQTNAVRVVISGRFQCDGGNPVLLRLRSELAVEGERMTLIVAAFQDAVNEVMQALLEKI